MTKEGFDLGPDPGYKCSEKWANLKRPIVQYSVKCQQIGSSPTVLNDPPPYLKEKMAIEG